MHFVTISYLLRLKECWNVGIIWSCIHVTSFRKVKGHGRCHRHLQGSCIKASGKLRLLIWGIKTFPLYLFSRSRGAWHLCDVPDPGFVPACVSNIAFFTMCHCQGTCKSTNTTMVLILEKWSDVSIHNNKMSTYMLCLWEKVPCVFHFFFFRL